MASKSQSLAFTAVQSTPGQENKRILLVDDDNAIRVILRHLLTEEGYRVLTAANGEEALQLACEDRFDLVLLDLNMPEMDGWETLEVLAESQPLLPVIVITARPNQRVAALSAGVGALLEKPLDVERLLLEIPRLLGEPRQVRLARLAGRPAGFSYVSAGIVNRSS